MRNNIKIYLAGPFNKRPHLRKMGEKLLKLGHQITASWLREPPKPLFVLLDSFEKQTAIKDLCDIAEADLVIIDLLHPSTTGGRLVEMGYAMARQKAVWIIGPAHSIFHRLADRSFKSWNECLKYLRTIK